MSFAPFPDQAAMDKLAKEMEDFTTSFSTFMLLGFFEAAIDEAKKECEPEVEDDPEQLLSPPVPDWPLKKGFITKEGGNYQSWKKRYFVARNQNSDFLIDYYADETCDEKTKKGSISCAGYHVEKSDAKKPNGITLVPYDSDRRTWHLQCENAAEQKSWLSVFENATWHAKPKGDPDPVINVAFQKAFTNLKNARGIYWSMRFDRSPEEMLAKLLITDLDRSLFPEILEAIQMPGGIGVTMARNSVRKMLVQSCASACAAAWAGAKPAIGLAKSVVMDKVKPGVKPIVEAQVKLRGLIVEKVMSVAAPVTDKLREIVFTPAMALVFGPMAEAFKAAIKGFHVQTTAKLGTMKETPVFREMTSNVSYSYWHESPMVEAYQILQGLNGGALSKLCEAMPGLSAAAFTSKLDSMLRALIRRALYTMHKLAESMEPAAALAKTTAQLVHDARLIFCKVVFGGFIDLIEDFYTENLVKPCLELVAPISESIPEAFKTLLSIDGLLEESLKEILDKTVKACTSGGALAAAGGVDAP
jgi:hypothetical protein